MSPKEECEALLNELLPMSTKFLKKYGEFFPCCVVMNTDGTMTHIGHYDGNEHPNARDVMKGLQDACRQFALKGEIKASGIAWNASVSLSDNQTSDAIIVSLEHQDNYSVKVVLPYRIRFPRRLTLGNLLAQEGERIIF